jgi:hypothetical protein
MKRFMNKKVVAIGLAAGLTLGAAGAAFAYFTSTGDGTGSASVGTSTGWNVAVTSDSTNTLLPGSGSETLTYTVTNESNGAQALNAVTPSFKTDSSGDVLANGTPVVGCLASWFTVTNNNDESPALLTSIASGHTTTGTVTVTMQDSLTNQDVCKNIAGPDVNIHAS